MTHGVNTAHGDRTELDGPSRCMNIDSLAGQEFLSRSPARGDHGLTIRRGSRFGIRRHGGMTHEANTFAVTTF